MFKRHCFWWCQLTSELFLSLSRIWKKVDQKNYNRLWAEICLTLELWHWERPWHRTLTWRGQSQSGPLSRPPTTANQNSASIYRHFMKKEIIFIIILTWTLNLILSIFLIYYGKILYISSYPKTRRNILWHCLFKYFLAVSNIWPWHRRGWWPLGESPSSWGRSG